MNIIGEKEAKKLLGTPDQLGFVVDDLEAAAEAWGQRCGVGPFFYFDTAPYDMVYRRQPSAPTMGFAFAYMGDTQIELIQQHDNAPSVYHDFKVKAGEGLLHMGSYVAYPKDDANVVAARGCEMLQFNWDDDGKEDCIYYETVNHPGALVEFINGTPARLARAKKLKRISREWDGKSHFRPFAAIAELPELGKYWIR